MPPVLLYKRADFMRLYLLTSERQWRKPTPMQSLDALLSEQRMVVQERVQLQCMTMLGAWHRERPPALPPDMTDSQLSDERRRELEVARADE